MKITAFMRAAMSALMSRRRSAGSRRTVRKSSHAIDCRRLNRSRHLLQPPDQSTVFAAPGEPGMGQQHDRQLRAMGACDDKAVDMQAGMGAAGGAKQHVELAVQKFGQ